MSITCNDRGEEGLTCQCETSSSLLVYEFTGTNIDEGCEGALDQCVMAPTAFTDERTCSPPTTETGANSCTRSQVCSERVAVADGIHAVDERLRSVYCGDHSGELRCSCSNTDFDVVFFDSNLEAACETSFEWCDSEPTPEFDDEPRCTVMDEDLSEGTCLIIQQCSETAQLAPDARAQRDTSQVIACTSGPDGSTLCPCPNGDVTYRLDGAVTAERCNDALALCSSETPVMPTGMLHCQSESTEFTDHEDGSCWARVDCERATDHHDVLGLVSGLSAHCAPNTPETWECSCGGEAFDHRLAIDAPSDWGCDGATRLCATAAEVHACWQ